MKLCFALLAVLALPACVDTGEEIELGVAVTRAEIHVDTTQPAALAEPIIHLDVFGGAHSHYISVDGAWLSLDGGLSQRLDLTLDDPAINIPANAYLVLALVNHGTHNSDLAALCQKQVPITVYVEMPGYDAGGTLAPGQPLSIFCP